MKDFKKEETVFIISKEVIKMAKAEKRIRTRLQLALKLSDSDIEVLLEENSPHGKLLTPKGIDIFQQETGIPPIRILVEVPVSSIKKSKRYPVFAE